MRPAAPRTKLPFALLLALVVAMTSGYVTSARQGPLPSAPILFVTQVPNPADFATIGSVFANHKGSVTDAPRGGDLWIRYPDGTLKNLTAAAGYGMSGMQGAAGIAVREPSVHWDGTKAVLAAERFNRLDFHDPHSWEVIARLPEDQGGHPLLVTGSHGKGRTLAWTSDIGPHWLPTPFVEWPGYARLWRQALAWLTGK